MRRFKRLIPYVIRQWRWLSAIFVLTLLSSASGALRPWPLKLLVDYALGGESVPVVLTSGLESVGLQDTPSTLVVFSAAVTLALFALNSALSIGLNLCWTLGGQRMVYDLAGDLFARLQRLSLRFHARQSVGDSLSRLTGDTRVVCSVADTLFMTPVQHVLTLCGMLFIGFALDPVLATLAVVMTPLLALSSRFFGKRLKRRARLGREAKSRLMSFVHQTFRAIPLVQAYGTQSRHTEGFRDLAEDAVLLTQRGNLLGSSYGLINGLITTTGVALVLYVGGVRVLSGAIPLGTLLVFLAYVRKMQSASGGLFKIFTKLKSAEASLDRVMEVMESDDFLPEVRDSEKVALAPRNRPVQVCFEGISFGYEPDQPVLQEVTLEALPGEVVALVGPTGAGKSTLVSLLPRFYDPWEGRVTIDGIDIRRVKLAELRSQISIVLQDPFLMPLSVADNISYGQPDASHEAIRQAAIGAQADSFISRLPDGYETVIGEGGTRLSGGERQRLSIARALLKDAPLLILDEPTSSLDVETEVSLVDALQRLVKERTTFIIAHRLSTIQHADRIAVLDAGRLVQLGSHAELLAQEGLYHRFYTKQASTSQGRATA